MITAFDFFLKNEFLTKPFDCFITSCLSLVVNVVGWPGFQLTNINGKTQRHFHQAT